MTASPKCGVVNNTVPFCSNEKVFRVHWFDVFLICSVYFFTSDWMSVTFLSTLTFNYYATTWVMFGKRLFWIIFHFNGLKYMFYYILICTPHNKCQYRYSTRIYRILKLSTSVMVCFQTFYCLGRFRWFSFRQKVVLVV